MAKTSAQRDPCERDPKGARSAAPQALARRSVAESSEIKMIQQLRALCEKNGIAYGED
jgi:hypothetical protein